MKYTRIIATVVLAMMIVSAESAAARQVATPAVAGDPPQPSIDFYPKGAQPGSFIDVELDPGEQVTLTMVMGNNGQVDFEAVTYAANAYSIRNGGFGLELLDGVPAGPTTWLDYETEYFQTTAGKQTERTFTITVPPETTPGEYVTGIAMQTANPVNEAADEGMFRYNQYYRSAIGIRVMVPGPMQAVLEIGDPQIVTEGGMDAISVPITNTGNQQASPAGEVRLYAADGALVLSAPVQMGQIFGGHQTELWLGLTNPLPEGTYALDLTLGDAAKNVQAERLGSQFDVVPASSPAPLAAIQITSASVQPAPDAANVQFANIAATISNTGDPVANAQLSLIAHLDGEEVERFAIVQSLSLPTGDTPITTRYIPATGWTSGEWTFEVLIETVEPGGAAVVVGRQPVEGSIVIP